MKNVRRGWFKALEIAKILFEDEGYHTRYLEEIENQIREETKLKMTYEEKQKWLERIFSNDPAVRRKAMEENIPRPLFETGEELGKAIDELLATKKRKEDTDQ